MVEADQQFINGALVDSQSTEWIDVENPYSNEVIARSPQGNQEDVNREVEAAKAAQPAWGNGLRWPARPT
jgi:acyl-CoA reductase-like NAD-dependent aldehyde dehydrogenase